MLGPKACPQAALKAYSVTSLKRELISEISVCQTAASRNKLKGGQIPKQLLWVEHNSELAIVYLV